ncbi:MAG TPA: response regulator transcription factor [Ktedonobacteraceae bacterium]|jgi:DNA-binding NarL/FixJ family response regulator
MELKVLVAASSDILRAGLRTVLTEDKCIVQVYEAATKEEVQTQLHSKCPDFIVINQSLITDMASLPRGHFVILAAALDLDTLQRAYKYGARGYLLENTSAELLRATLYLQNGAFLIEPTIAFYTMDYFLHGLNFTIRDELLSPREQEIVKLLRDGIDRRTIAKQLCISDTTLKKHIQHIKNKSNTSSKKALEIAK